MALDRMYRASARLLACALVAFAGAPSAGLAQVTTYRYDELGRLVTAVNTDGKTVAYAYDAAGNRTQVGNVAGPQEVIPTAFTASSNVGSSGLTNAVGMRDGVGDRRNSNHVTQSTAGSWIRADLGIVRNVDHIRVLAAVDASWAVSETSTNDTAVEYSVDGGSWITVGTIVGVVPGAYTKVTLGGVLARYVRVHRAATGRVGLGDFRLFAQNTGGNLAPAPVDDTFNLAINAPATQLDVLLNDTDPNPEDTPNLTIQSESSANAVRDGLNKFVIYTPAPDFSGTENFSYVVADGRGKSATANVTVKVGGNRPPIAVGDDVGTAPGTPITFDVMDNDSDPDNDPLTFTTYIDGHPWWLGGGKGTAVFSGPRTLTYSPYGVGTDSFWYQIEDGKGGTARAEVRITVACGAGANHPPTAGVDYHSVPPNQATILSQLLLNDKDVDCDTKTIQSVTQPEHGVTTHDATTVTYTPTPGYNNASDTFQYTLRDPEGATDVGTVNLYVESGPINQPPVAVDDGPFNVGGYIDINVLGNDTDTDSTNLQVHSTTSGSHGWTVIIENSKKVRYLISDTNHIGLDTFTYVVRDNDGNLAEGTVTVNLIDQPPVAIDWEYGVSYNTPKQIDLDILSGDSQGQSVSYSITGAPAKGTYTLVGATLTYQPNAGASGADSITYTVTDSGGQSDSGNIALSIAAPSGFQVPISGITYQRQQGPVQNVWSAAANIVVTPQGGTAPYEYDWERVADPATPDTYAYPTNDNAASTAFLSSRPFGGALQMQSTWRVKVTDSNTIVAYSPNVVVKIDYEDGQ